MASSRKKQDEKNLKTLRELGALPQNKYCFDCNQRGPTYVNVTIGSFVCTKCSGMLRGLTPPHRVKSISMATFTPDEIDLLKNRGGNEYCKSVWLGLYEGITPPSANCSGDDQGIRDLMIDKYEKKRFYLDPIETMRNGHARSTSSPSSDEMIIGSSTTTTTTSSKNSNSVVVNGTVRPLTTLVSDPRPIKLNGSSTTTTKEYCNRKRPEPAGGGNSNNNTGSAYAGFAVNFDKADIFSSNGYSSTENNKLNNNFSSNLVTIANGSTTTTSTQQQQPSFANFDDNPVFVNNNTTDDEFSIFDLKFTNSGPVLNQVPLFPKCNSNHRWSMPTSVTFDSHNHTTNNLMNNNQNNRGLFAPPEDKYAALKDLDNALKQNHQNGFDWNSSSGSNGSLYSSSTPTGSMYSSPSPQSSMFGSPSQGNFMNAFQPTNTTNQDHQHHHTTAHTKNITSNGGSSNGTFSNPFNLSNGHTTNGGLTWGNNNSNSSSNNGFSNANHTNFAANGQSPFANPFRDQQPIKTQHHQQQQQQNGFTANFQQQAMFPTMVAANGGSPWGVNPFQPVGATAASNANSNNPFL